jgi:hypothetical protein
VNTSSGDRTKSAAESTDRSRAVAAGRRQTTPPLDIEILPAPCTDQCDPLAPARPRDTGDEKL